MYICFEILKSIVIKKFITVFGLLFSAMIFSQSYVGFLSDNYSGVHTVINNPANIVDSPYRTDINLFGVSGLFGNDYFGENFLDFINSHDNDDYILEKEGTRYPLSSNNVIGNLDILGPSFMFNINPKHAIAVSSRFRSMGNINNLNGKLIEILEDENGYEEKQIINVGTANANTHTWGEIGLSYATVLMDKKQHFLKGGLSLKYLLGTGTAKISTKDVTLTYDSGPTKLESDDSASFKGSIIYGYTENYDASDNFIVEDIGKSTGFGADLGFTYEWRPEIDKYSYSSNEGKTMYYRDANKYKLKASLSLTDLGRIKYIDALEEAYDLTRTVTQTESNLMPNGLDFNEQLDYYFVQTNSKKTVTSKLPTAIHLTADWNINQHFYLNLETNFDIADKENATNIENTYVLTPRFESKWISAYIPISYREFSGLNTGFGLRAGPLYVGSGSIISNLIAKESKGADIYLGFKIPFYQSKPKDKDGDGIFDKFDRCPKEAGPKENNGCPWGDKDKDSVKDNVDKCPEVTGPSENNGCPWGDKDEDGVTDNLDECPDTNGLKQFKGCPDTDNDGVADKSDKCPKVKGDKDFGGCPKDSDGDGIVDTKDKCPKVAGVKAENGCPEKVVIITEEAKKTINSYAKSIYFNSGKTSFLPGVTEKLDMIVKVMGEYTDAKFTIEGHTDSQGKRTTNQRLSEKRAKAVLSYLVVKGIDASRLNSYGFGEDHPIDTNKTKVGRSNNRRVEIKLHK